MVQFFFCDNETGDAFHYGLISAIYSYKTIFFLPFLVCALYRDNETGDALHYRSISAIYSDEPICFYDFWFVHFVVTMRLKMHFISV